MMGVVPQMHHKLKSQQHVTVPVFYEILILIMYLKNTIVMLRVNKFKNH